MIILESPVKHIKDKFSAAYSDNRNLLIDIFQKADAWILWFIGFSIGGLALFAGNLDKFCDKLTTGQIHQIFINLFISVISGIIYRYVYIWFYLYLMQDVYGRIFNDFDSKNDFPVFKELVGGETFAELVIRLNTYTGESFNDLLLKFSEADEQKKIELCSVLIDYYQKAKAFNDEEITKGLNFVNERLQVYHGKRLEKLQAKHNVSRRLFTFRYYLLISLGVALLFTFLITFGVALCTFCFNVHL
jgi:hypothetical protein